MPMLLRFLDAIFMLVIAVALIWFGSSAFGSSCPARNDQPMSESISDDRFQFESDLQAALNASETNGQEAEEPAK